MAGTSWQAEAVVTAKATSTDHTGKGPHANLENEAKVN